MISAYPKNSRGEVKAEFVTTVPEVGWATIQNGALLKLAEQNLDVFLTNDQNLEHQQNLRQFNLAIIVLVALTNDVEDLKPLMPAANEVLNKISAGEIVYIKAPVD